MRDLGPLGEAPGGGVMKSVDSGIRPGFKS